MNIFIISLRVDAETQILMIWHFKIWFVIWKTYHAYCIMYDIMA